VRRGTAIFIDLIHQVGGVYNVYLPLWLRRRAGAVEAGGNLASTVPQSLIAVEMQVDVAASIEGKRIDGVPHPGLCGRKLRELMQRVRSMWITVAGV
jgi:hypothetical protein